MEHARKRGQTVYVETCPQYLLLDESVYYTPDYSQAARYVCARPSGTRPIRSVLWRGLRRGEIQTISTDHCSFTLAQKDMGREDFTKIPGGLPGVETRGELIYSYGVASQKICAGPDVPGAEREPRQAVRSLSPQGRAAPRQRRATSWSTIPAPAM
ncbi:MAG: hypothetical protein ACLSHO_07845 [Dysosmobacter sp.]